MFTLTEDRLRPDLAWLGLAAGGAGAWLMAMGLLGGQRLIAAAGAAGVLLGLLAFTAQLVRVYAIRRRRTFDVHIPFAVTGAAFGLSAAALLLYGLLSGAAPGAPEFVAAGWLAIAGWAQTPIQGFLYKIGTFLTWLNRYAPVAGLAPVPKLEDMYNRQQAIAGWLAWTIGVSLGALAALVGQPEVATLGGVSLSLGVLLFLINAFRVGAHWRAHSAPVSLRSISQ
jgi:hypothetical protein